MRMNEEMEKLGKEIIGSYDVRVESIKQLKKETEETLKNFQEVHQKMSLDQREYLSKYKDNLEGEVKETLKGFRLSLEKMGSDLRNDLAEGVERRKAEVSQTLDELTNSRMQMSKELKEDLAAGVEKRKEEVSKTLDDFKVSHLQMSKELKENLSKFNQEIKSEVSKMLDDFHSTQDKVRAELEKASLSWQQTASILQEKRSGVKPIPKVLEKKTIKEALPKKAKISEELSDKKQLIKLINGHPEGIKLTEIGAQLEKDWRWYIPIVKELMEEGKIRKEENLYYPAI